MHLEQLELNDKVNKIKALTFNEIISSENVMLLLTTYSALYLNNQAPSYCERCMRGYYEQILKEGTERAILIMEAKNRTLIPNWDGIKYINGSFFDSSTITDNQAIQAIEKGVLKEKHFKKMPEMKVVSTEQIIEVVKENRRKGRKK